MGYWQIQRQCANRKLKHAAPNPHAAFAALGARGDLRIVSDM
jgi:hypothetical protein